MSGVSAEMDRGFEGVGRRFDSIERKLDKLPGEWAMAKVVFFVVGALMTAAIWGPRALSLLSPASP